MDIGRLDLSIQKGEGCKLTAYQDTEGVWTIGWGTNLQTLRITQEQADLWKTKQIKVAIALAQMFPEFKFLDTDARQNAFVEMLYEMGPHRVGGFTDMLAAIRAQDWPKVKAEALDSKWHKQVGHRAEVLAEMFLTGQFS